ncbi:tyrosine-type recombinase/integrase [Streptomyces sp. CAI-85]|uniref:tyrosine-type recombinase/integrase n=1 Tax=Streptomyces sp. CAI-85 TaxID=1472662 RepID=UPI0015876FF1|nr:tyrosine-type recombinase/integrase [Streptomyces sp. CAI-85]NUV60646.1 site-specific integrase [Streptomyces sp. CAI-85]
MAEIKKVILQNGKTRYRFVVDAGRDENGKRKQLTVTKDTRKEAQEEYARIVSQKATGSFVAPNKMTVAELLDAWLDKKARDLEASTMYGYRNALVHVREYLGHIRVQELTDDDVESMVAWLLVGARRRGGKPGTGIRPSTAQGVLARLREALGWAVVRKYVHANVALYVQIPRRAWKEDRRANRRVQPWNVVEVKDFLIGIREDRLFAPLMLCLMGLRPAEVAGLRWSLINLDAGTLAIDNTRTMIGNAEVLEKDTKTEAGERVLPLPEPVRQALLAFKALQEIEEMSMGSYYASSGYVFVDHIGQALTTRHLRERAYALMERLELRRVRLYDARHSCLTFLAVNGVPDVILAAWAGHVSAAFTKRVYVHPSPDDLRTASDHLTVLLGFGDEVAA